MSYDQPSEYVKSGTIINKINLCDPAQEPSDEDLARLMGCVAYEATIRSEKAAQALSAEIDHEVAKALGRIS